MTETDIQDTINSEATPTVAPENNDIKFTIGASQDVSESVSNTIVEQSQSTQQENTADSKAPAENTNVEQKKIAIGFKKEEPEQIFSTLKEKFGREIDEDYLTNDYKSLYTSTEEKLKAIQTQSEVLDDEVIKSIVEYKKKGGDLKDFFYAQTIDPETIPIQKLIKDFVDRANPEYDELIKEMELTHKYGLGIDLEAEIEEAKDNGDSERLYKLVEIKKNRIDAINAQKQHINAQKVELLSKQPNVQNQEEIQKQYEAKLGEYAKYANENLTTIRDLTLGDFSLGEQKADPSYIGYKDDNGLLYVQGISDKDLTEAIFIYKNKDAIFKKIREELNVEAEIKTDKIYNNPVESHIIPTSSSGNGQIKFTIKN